VSSLHFSTLVQDGVPRAGDQRMPDGNRLVSSPLTTTLILGEREAALVDPPFTMTEPRAKPARPRPGSRTGHDHPRNGVRGPADPRTDTAGGRFHR
jgi:hypothetical protein